MKIFLSIVISFLIIAGIFGRFIPEGKPDLNNEATHLYMAENYLKSKLNDPGSYKRYKYSQGNVSEGVFVNTINYGAKNGFGGMVRNVAVVETSTEDGKKYISISR